MSKKQVKIQIGGRNYPITVEATEEDAVFGAEKLIQENVDKLKRIYNITNPQDLLAMTALEFATKLQKNQKEALLEEDKNTIQDIATLLKNI